MRKTLLWILVTMLAGCTVDREPDVDRIMAEYGRAGMPGASVMVIKDGEPLLTRSYGLARLDDDTPGVAGKSHAPAYDTEDLAFVLLGDLIELTDLFVNGLRVFRDGRLGDVVL